LMGPRAYLDTVARRKFTAPAENRTSGCSVVTIVAELPRLTLGHLHKKSFTFTCSYSCVGVFKRHSL